MSKDACVDEGVPVEDMGVTLVELYPGRERRIEIVIEATDWSVGGLLRLHIFRADLRICFTR